VAEGTGYRYSPTAGYSGTDTFDYQLTDEFGAQSASARVTITVSAPATPPAGGGKKKGGGALEWLTLAALLGVCSKRLRASHHGAGL
jgi:hypothetical protein